MTRIVLLAGLALAAAAAVYDPGIAAAGTVLAFAGWLRAESVNSGALARLRQAGLELEIAGERNARLESRLDGIAHTLANSAVLRVEGMTEAKVHVDVRTTFVDGLGEPPSEAVH